MEKTCFIIMPISEFEPYISGHFKRVYEYIIKPACNEAGFKPIRADDVLNTNYIAIDVIRKIINSDMAICDLSGKNPNVFYELGIRQAFNLPITLIRDSLTDRVFDIQGFRDIEYDQSLRIDNVDNIVKILSETITNTYETKGKEINSLISLLGIHPAIVTTQVEISKDTELILNTLTSLGSRLNQIEKFVSLKPSVIAVEQLNGTWKDLTPSEAKDIKVGDIVEHDKFGKGVVTSREGSSQNPIASIAFDAGDSKKVMLNYAKLKRIFKTE